MRKILLSPWLHIFLLIILITLFILCLVISLADIPKKDFRMSVSDVWDAFSGISIPLTFLLFMLDGARRNDQQSEANRIEVLTVIDLFLNDLHLFVEHLKTPFSFDLKVLNSLNKRNHKRIHKLMLLLYQLGKLAPNDTHENRKNYIMRLKIDQFFTELLAIKNPLGIEYSAAEGIQVNNRKEANTGKTGDELMVEDNNQIYDKQKGLLKSFDSAVMEEILIEIKRLLDVNG